MKASSLISSVGFNYLGTLVVTVLGFALTPIVLGHVGAHEYGVWALIGGVMAYAALLDFGIGLTIMRLVAERAHLTDKRPLRVIASTGLLLYGALGVVVGIVGLSLTPVLRDAFGLAGNDTFTQAYHIMVVTIAITFPAGMYTGLNNGLGRYAPQNAIVIGQAIVQTAGSILAVLSGGGIVALAWVTGSAAVVGYVAKIGYAAVSYQVYPSLSLFSTAAIRTTIRVSSVVFVIMVTTRIIWEADAIVAGTVLGAVAVAHYAVALGPATAVRRLAEQFNSVSLTAAAGLRAQGDDAGLRRLLVETTRVSVAIVAPFIALFSFWGDDFLRAWVGPDFAGSAPTLTILLAGMLLGAMQATASMVLFACDAQRVVAAVAVVEALANLTLSVLLAQSLGVVGIAVGTAVPTGLTTFLFYLPYASRKVGIGLWTMACKLQAVIIPSLVLAGICWAIDAAGAVPANLVVFGIVTGMLILIAIVVGVVADRDERPTYQQVFTNVVATTRFRHAARRS